jgi:hypothetical protein
MFRVLLLGLFITPTFSLDINKIESKAPKNFLEVRTTCYLTNDERIRNPGPIICPTLAHLVKKFKNTKTLDRYVACHNIKADYLLLVPEYCTVTYCTPCTYKLV